MLRVGEKSIMFSPIQTCFVSKIFYSGDLLNIDSLTKQACRDETHSFIASLNIIYL